MADDQVWENGKMDERRRPGASPVGDATAVSDNVKAQLAIRRLHRSIDFLPRRLPAAVEHDQLEVLDQALDTAVRCQLVRKDDLAVNVHVDWPARQVFNGLIDDVNALDHFLHAHQVAGVAIPGRGTDDLEIQIRISQVRFVFSQIAHHAAGPGNGAGAAQIDGIFL